MHDHASFFHLAGTEITDQPCQGTACFVAGNTRGTPLVGGGPRVACLGRCYQAPATAVDAGRPIVQVDAPIGVVVERLARGGAAALHQARDLGAYEALAAVLAGSASDIVAEVERSELRGRGGAGFPTGRKWAAVARASESAGRAYVVANADEGDPGAYIDRFLLEDDPHAVIEGLAIAAVAVGAATGYVYVRKEYPAAFRVLERAVADARAAGVLGTRLLGEGPPFDVEVVSGEGSYVCGEETALLNHLEHRRPEVRARPPYPAQHGLFGVPTLVNNVETLAAIPWIVRHGGRAYAAMGHGTSRGTKVVSLNSLFRRPGLYEVEFGVPVRHIVEDLGGGLAQGELRGVMIGGPLAGILPPHLLDTQFTFDDLRAVGCDVGHGGVIAFDEQTSIVELVHHVFRFGADESCGKCTPCRVGTARIAELAAAVAGGAAAARPAGLWEETVAVLESESLCGHGTGLAAFARSAAEHYGLELAGCLD